MSDVGSKVAAKWTERVGNYAAKQRTVAETPGTTGHASSVAKANPTSNASSAAPGKMAAQGKPTGAGAAILGAVGEAFAFLTSVEKTLSAPIAAIPFPGLPAACIADAVVGFPHAHMHWPNIIPPSPVPIPLPSLGPITPIPYLSGADTVSIRGSKAARCGDLALSIWCGGYFPLTELFTGSASVWVEGARAGRMLDITKHCIFSVPKPTDPPLGPFFGGVASGESSVLIGGAPMPSLTALAIAAAMKGAGKLAPKMGRLGASAFRKTAAVFGRDFAREARILDRFLEKCSIKGLDTFVDAAKKDLARMVKTKAGRELLEDLAKSGKNFAIEQADSEVWKMCGGAAAFPVDGKLAHAVPNYHPGGGLQVIDGKGGSWAADFTPNRGTGSTVKYTPWEWPNGRAAKTPSDVVLFHELTHSRNMANGEGLGSVVKNEPGFESRWKNMEEFNTVANENRYRAERGIPQRTDYTSPMP